MRFTFIAEFFQDRRRLRSFREPREVSACVWECSVTDDTPFQLVSQMRHTRKFHKGCYMGGFGGFQFLLWSWGLPKKPEEP